MYISIYMYNIHVCIHTCICTCIMYVLVPVYVRVYMCFQFHSQSFVYLQCNQLHVCVLSMGKSVVCSVYQYSYNTVYEHACYTCTIATTFCPGGMAHVNIPLSYMNVQVTEDRVLDVVEKVLQSPQSSQSTRDYAINAIMKLSIRYICMYIQFVTIYTYNTCTYDISLLYQLCVHMYCTVCGSSNHESAFPQQNVIILHVQVYIHVHVSYCACTYYVLQVFFHHASHQESD